MNERQDFFSRVYELETAAETQDLYDEWATTYESDVTDHGYETPARCASALASCMDNLSAPVLDFGCGTGLSGQALVAAGFTAIDGADINGAMLELARSKQVYRELIQTSIDNPIPPEIGVYGAVSAIGSIGIGAAQAPVLEQLLVAMGPSMLLAFSLNDHTLEQPVYVDTLSRFVSAGSHEVAFEDYGPHLTELNLKSRVWVVRRLD
ncbi:MAG: methyltransferase domain-containing protein [Rhodobacteraceae bacterium]|nr:methyltransferase domain-containing protein [Paracoccaceae bacterium]